jgi:hypothetical protein
MGIHKGPAKIFLSGTFHIRQFPRLKLRGPSGTENPGKLIIIHPGMPSPDPPFFTGF